MEIYNPYFTINGVQNDIILLLCSFIEKERDLIIFLSTCKCLLGFKKLFLYKKVVAIADINGLDYYDQFTKINLSRNAIIHHRTLPQNLTTIVLDNYNGTLNFLERIHNITHLVIKGECQIVMSRSSFVLPSSLKYLKWKIVQRCPKFLLNSIKEVYLSGTLVPIIPMNSSIEKITFGKKIGLKQGTPFAFPLNIKLIIFESFQSYRFLRLHISIHKHMDIIHLHLKFNDFENRSTFYHDILHLTIRKKCQNNVFVEMNKWFPKKLEKLVKLLPNKLKTLCIEENIIMPDEYPTTLEEITVTKNIKQEIINSLPKGVKIQRV